MQVRRASILLLLATAFAVGGAAQAGETNWAFEAEDLPPGWRIDRGIVVPGAQLGAFGDRLGGAIASLTNQFVSVNGFTVRVNAIVGVGDEDAAAIEKTMLELRGPDFVEREGRTVYEVAGANVLVARRVFAALGFEAAPRLWDATFRIALIDDLDYTAGNRVFNHFLALERNPDDEAAVEGIRRETESWTFGDVLRLRNADPPGEWTFDPEPREIREGGLATTYRFEDAPKLHGVPYVNVRGRVRTVSRFEPDGDASPSEGLLDPTARWPADAKAVRDIARSAAGAENAREKVLALLRAANQRVRYGGPMGTRDGVLEVLERGYGRCWDRSDVLITLCRAAGVPARQVGGWVPPIRAGHIWTEVRLDGGWIPVDATTSWLGASADYIPLFASEGGPMPIVYLAMPRFVPAGREPEDG